MVDPAKLDRLVYLSTAVPGECFKEAPETDGLLAELVNCSGTWDFRAISVIQADYPNGYPGENHFDREARTGCDRRYSHLLYPSSESWQFGDRAVHCLQDSFGLSSVDPAKLDRLVDLATAVPGECFNEAPETDGLLAELVSCSGPWAFRVLSLIQVEHQNEYPGEAYFDRVAWSECDRRYSYLLYPSSQTWEIGDRTVHCLQDSFGLSSADPAKLDRLVDLSTAVPGECFNEAPETDDLLVELVSCSGPWAFQITKALTVPMDGGYPGAEYFNELTAADCEEADFTFTPNPESWNSGDRKVLCILANPS